MNPNGVGASIVRPLTEEPYSISAKPTSHIERVLAWTLSAITITASCCFFMIMTVYRDFARESLWGLGITVGAALALACITLFIAVTVLFMLTFGGSRPKTQHERP